MAFTIRIATFNLENLDDRPSQALSVPTFEERTRLMRPQLARINADILCLQEVHGQQVGGVRRLRALDQLLAGTPYVGFNLVSTIDVVVDPTSPQEDVAPLVASVPSAAGGPSVKPERNLIVLSRFPIGPDRRQMKHVFIETPPAYKRVTAEPPDAAAQLVTWERPILYTTIQVAANRVLHIINVHLKSKLPVTIPGQKIRVPGQQFDVWKTVAGRAEGSFLAAMQRVGQALEIRTFIDSLFEQDENALIVVCGDFNADDIDVPLEAIHGDVEDTENPQLATRVMVSCERTVPEPSRFSLIHRGRGVMLDHIVVSRPLLAFYKGTEIHNEILHDESQAFATDKKFPESDHAPIIVTFEFP